MDIQGQAKCIQGPTDIINTSDRSCNNTKPKRSHRRDISLRLGCRACFLDDYCQGWGHNRGKLSQHGGERSGVLAVCLKELRPSKAGNIYRTLA